MCKRSLGFFSRAFLVFLMKESKKRRRKQPGKLMAKSCSQPVNLPGAWPLMNPLLTQLGALFFIGVVKYYAECPEDDNNPYQKVSQNAISTHRLMVKLLSLP